MRNLLKLVSLIFVTLLVATILSGCGSSVKKQSKDTNKTELSIDDNNSTDNSSTNSSSTDSDNYAHNSSTDKNITIIGKVVDGEVSGATVFLDLNQNDERESGEPMTITKSDGSFTLILEKSHQEHKNYLSQTAPLVAFGGTDIRTNKPFEDYLMAMTEGKDEVIISPITTLIMQSLKEEIKKDNQKLFQKTVEEIVAEVQSKIDAIKQNISELLGISKDLLTKDPIALAKKGDNTLLNKSLQLHKTAREMKKAMRKEVRGLRQSILSSYRSLGREFKKLKKEALKNGENALVKALDTAMSDSTIFDADLVKNVKRVSTELIKSINDFWSGREVALSDNELNNAITALEVITDSGTETGTGTTTGTETGTGTTTGTETTTGTGTTTSTTVTRADALKFLRQASFRTNEAEITYVMNNGYEAWIDKQFSLVGDLDNDTDDKYGYLESSLRLLNKIDPTTYPTSTFSDPTLLDETILDKNRINTFRASVFWDKALQDENQLRQRVAYALSQIIVVADTSPVGKATLFRGESISQYFDILYKHSFGNYRELLTDVTYSSAMGYFMTYIGSKSDAPDENYARELTQLFTIGLYELNDDGTPQGSGTPTPSYNQAHVTNLSKVFTGWSLDDKQLNSRDAHPPFGSTGKKDNSWSSPLKFTAQYHDTSDKTILGNKVVAGNADGSVEIKQALDYLFANHNVAPFISRHLIMRLVTSNPTPAYVGRVSAVFNNNGSGVKGDLKAVVKAILLDPEARGVNQVDNFGKVDEMLVAFTHFLSAFNAHPIPHMNFSPSVRVDNIYWLSPDKTFEQALLSADSVFNFYSNEFIPSDTYFATNNLVAPELQIQNTPNLIRYSNLIKNLMQDKEKYKLTHPVIGAYNSMEEWATDRNYGQFTLIDGLLYLDLTPEYEVLEKALDNETVANKDFANMGEGTGANADRTRAINALLDHLDNKLLGGTMPQEYKTEILRHLESLNYTKNDRNRTLRARAIVTTAIQAIVTSSLFMVLK